MKNNPDYNIDKLYKISVQGVDMFITERFQAHYGEDNYEKLSADVFSMHAKAGNNVVDIGAHYGYYSLIAGKNGANIFAFEPVKENFEILEKNIKLNNFQNIKAFNFAVSNVERDRPFNVAEASDSSGFYEHPLTKTIETRIVHAISIDKFFPDQKIDLVKIDTEGHEIEVLEGMEDVIRRNPEIKLLIEFNPKCLKSAGKNPSDLLSWLHEKGFSMLLIKDKEGKKIEIGDNVNDWNKFMNPMEYVNIFCEKKKKILKVSFISHSAEIGGAEKSLLELMDGLVKRGILCNVLLPNNGPLEKELEERNISYDIIPFRWWNLRKGENKQDVMKQITENIIDIAEKINKINPDVIYTNTSVINIGALVARILRKPHVWHIREFGEKDHGLDFILPKKERCEYISNNSDLVIFNSHAVEENFLKFSKPKKHEVVYNNVKTKDDGLNEKIEYFTSDFKKLLILGTILSGKGQMDAIMAVDTLIKSGVEVELIIAGVASSDEYVQKIKGYITNQKIEKYVKILSFVKNPYSLIKESDIMLSCSISEAFGRTIPEAMLMGKAVIGANSGGVPEIIKNNFNGLLYKPGNYQELAKKIKFLYKNPKKLKVLSKKGNKFAKEHFSEQKYSGKIFDLLMKTKEFDKDLKNLEVSNLLYSNIQNIKSELRKEYQEILVKYQAILNKNKEIEIKNNEIQLKYQEIKNKNQTIQIKEKEIEQKDKEIQQKDQVNQQKEQEIKQKDQEIQEKSIEIQSKIQEIELIRSSKFWKLREKYINLKNKVGSVKKLKDFYTEARFSFQTEGTKKMLLRSINYVIYGKGVLGKKQVRQIAKKIIQEKEMYCLVGSGVQKTDILMQIENFLKDAKEECILLISHDASATGAPILVSHIAKVLNRNFKKKIVILTIKGGTLEREFERLGMVINLNQASLNSLNKTEEIDSIFKSLRKHGVEKCICNSVVSGILVPFLEKNNFDYVNLIHEQADYIRRSNFLDVLNNILKYPRKIVFSSEFVKSEFVEVFDRKLEDSIVRPQGLFFRNRFYGSKELAKELLRKKLNLPKNSKVVLAAGFADMRKGIDLFYKVAKRTKEKGEKNVEFVWLGDRDEDILKKLKNVAVKENFADKIHLRDFEKDPSVFFAGADAFLLTSREDPLPSVALMAMDCGVPVIAFDNTGGIPDLLKDGAGVVAAHLDADAMAKELIGLLADKEARERISTQAKKIIESEFDFGEYVKFLLGLFDKKTEIVFSAAAGSSQKISAVVPNYNYEKFLGERLYSIISQTHKPFEIIFLDDVSTDNSVEFAEKFLSKTDIPYRIIRNETNVGCFKQWAKGVREASGDLIWIAEADDSCEPELLEELAAKFEDPEVGLAYAQSVRIDEFGKKEGVCFPYVESAIGINDRWRKDHTNDGLNEICEYLSVKNIIVNASAVVMRRNLLLQLGDGIGGSFKLAGDWYTYVQILRNSKMAFSSLPVNYHRHHRNAIGSRSGSMPEKKARQLVSETIGMHDFILSNFPVSHKRSMWALEHVRAACRTYLGKELDEMSEYAHKLEIYKKTNE